MFGRLYDWCVMNRGRFGEMSFSFAMAHLWVMSILLVVNILYFANAFSGSFGSFEAISVIPWPVAEALPSLTADSGLGAFALVFLGACVFAPLVEEMFRAMVLQGACEDPKTGKMRNIFIILAMSFIFFGMIHGGYWNIFIQGALGLLLARQWFRVGQSKTWKYFSMVGVHAAYNFSVIGTQLMVVRALN